MKKYTHYSDYTGNWPWEHFSPTEVSCKHCGELYVDEDSMNALEELRYLWGKPIIITSGHRCPVHNKNVGGTPNSQHLKIAFDCVCEGRLQNEFVNLARQAGFTGIGRYRQRNFVHLDLGPKREWRG